MKERDYTTHPLTEEEIYKLKDLAAKEEIEQFNKQKIKRNKLNSNYTKPKKRRKK